MKNFFLALLLAASAACMAAQVAFADDSGFIAGGGSAGSGSGVGRDDIATSETATASEKYKPSRCVRSLGN